MLAPLIALFTGTPRYRPAFEWGYYWTFNAFRLWEQIAGRVARVTPESAAMHDGTIICFSLEAKLTALEIALRSAFRWKISFAYAPSFQFAGLSHTTLKLPYLFLITAPTNNQASLTGFASANPPSISMTPSGTERCLVFYSHALSNGSGATGVTASATFNTTESATSAGTHLNINNTGGLGQLSIWYRVNPSAVTANATVSITNSQGGGALNCVVYSGVHQTTPTNAYATNQATSTNASVSVTTTVANSYVTGFSYNNGVAITAGSGMTARITDGGGTRVLDSGNLTTPQSFSWNVSHSSQPWGAVAVALSPSIPFIPVIIHT